MIIATIPIKLFMIESIENLFLFIGSNFDEELSETFYSFNGDSPGLT